MKALVSAASKHGSTSEIADVIAEVLTGRGVETVVIPPADVGSIDGFGAVVLGSAVYAGHWLKPARELADRLGSQLAGRSLIASQSRKSPSGARNAAVTARGLRR